MGEGLAAGAFRVFPGLFTPWFDFGHPVTPGLVEGAACAYNDMKRDGRPAPINELGVEVQVFFPTNPIQLYPTLSNFINLLRSPG